MGTPVEGYACEVYLENLLNEDNYQSNMQVFVDLLAMADFCSPLHNRDKNKDGTPKKEHYHLLFNVNADKTTIATLLGYIATTSERLVTKRAVIPIYHYNNYYKYLTHSDKKSRLDKSKADYTKCKLLWKNPDAEEPDEDLTEFQGLMDYYTEHCDGLDYGSFLEYVKANDSVLLGCQDIHKYAFIQYVNSRHYKVDEQQRLLVERAAIERARQSKDDRRDLSPYQNTTMEDAPWE